MTSSPSAPRPTDPSPVRRRRRFDRRRVLLSACLAALASAILLLLLLRVARTPGEPLPPLPPLAMVLLVAGAAGCAAWGESMRQLALVVRAESREDPRL
jgi:hypothetical protein